METRRKHLKTLALLSGAATTVSLSDLFTAPIENTVARERTQTLGDLYRLVEDVAAGFSEKVFQIELIRDTRAEAQIEYFGLERNRPLADLGELISAPSQDALSLLQLPGQEPSAYLTQVRTVLRNLNENPEYSIADLSNDNIYRALLNQANQLIAHSEEVAVALNALIEYERDQSLTEGVEIVSGSRTPHTVNRATRQSEPAVRSIYELNPNAPETVSIYDLNGVHRPVSIRDLLPPTSTVRLEDLAQPDSEGIIGHALENARQAAVEQYQDHSILYHQQRILEEAQRSYLRVLERLRE